MQARLQLDQRTNRLVGSTEFNTDLRFESYADWVSFRDTRVAAGYIIPFCVCPVDPAIPSAIRIAALIPSDLTDTSADYHRYLQVCVHAYNATRQAA